MNFLIMREGCVEEVMNGSTYRSRGSNKDKTKDAVSRWYLRHLKGLPVFCPHIVWLSASTLARRRVQRAQWCIRPRHEFEIAELSQRTLIALDRKQGVGPVG